MNAHSVAWLFCPASRPERLAKAAGIADEVIVDLEDGVAPSDRPRAREHLVGASSYLDPARTVVRINAVGTADHERDVDALQQTPFNTVLLAKCDDPALIDGLGGLSAIALIETPRGVIAAERVAAHPRCVGLMWGSEDLAAYLGAISSRGSDGRLRAPLSSFRWNVLLAARAAGTIAIDAVYPSIDDVSGLEREAAEAASAGFDAKACIHPAQLPAVRRSFSPSPDEVAGALRLLAAAADHAGGAFALQGGLVDDPIVRQARRIVDRAQRHKGESLHN